MYSTAYHVFRISMPICKHRLSFQSTQICKRSNMLYFIIYTFYATIQRTFYPFYANPKTLMQCYFRLHYMVVNFLNNMKRRFGFNFTQVLYKWYLKSLETMNHLTYLKRGHEKMFSIARLNVLQCVAPFVNHSPTFLINSQFRFPAWLGESANVQYILHK